jgi:glycosyltransferase involved in cell wall biosynthesis
MLAGSSTQSDTPSKPRATIIVRAYNQEAIVAQAIQSCFDQTYPSLEIILSDDCSSDNTWQVIQRMAETYDGPHRVITNRNSENLGIVGHTNKTMAMATGELILSCAGDDIAHPQKTERLVECWTKQPKSIKAVSCGYLEMSLDGRDLGFVSAAGRRRRRAEPTALDVVRNNAYCLGAVTLWHCDVLKSFGPIPDMAPAEDNILLLRAAITGTVRYLDEPLVRKRVGGVSNPTGAPVVDEYFQSADRTCRNRIATLTAMSIDIEGLETVEKHRLKRALARRLGPLRLEARLSSSSQFRRLSELPLAIIRSLFSLNLTYLAVAAKYAFQGAYISYRRRRYG